MVKDITTVALDSARTAPNKVSFPAATLQRV
jgi:hypothetical protein